MPVYIAKPQTWFKEGTLAELLEHYYTNQNGNKFGLFRGTYVVGKNEGYNILWYEKGYKEGDEVLTNKVCSYNDFEIRDV